MRWRSHSGTFRSSGSASQSFIASNRASESSERGASQRVCSEAGSSRRLCEERSGEEGSEAFHWMCGVEKSSCLCGGWGLGCRGLGFGVYALVSFFEKIRETWF